MGTPELMSVPSVRAKREIAVFEVRSPKTGIFSASRSRNATPAVLLASERWARERDLPVLAFLRHGKAAAVDFIVQPENLGLAPAYVVAQLLADTQLSLQDFDYTEMHEAYAAQVLCTLEAWADAAFCRDRLGLAGALGRIDRARLNIKGGSLAFGSAYAATGARLLATLAHTLAEARAKRGLVAVCTAGGMGVGAILER